MFKDVYALVATILGAQQDPELHGSVYPHRCDSWCEKDCSQVSFSGDLVGEAFDLDDGDALPVALPPALNRCLDIFGQPPGEGRAKLLALATDVWVMAGRPRSFLLHYQVSLTGRCPPLIHAVIVGGKGATLSLGVMGLDLWPDWPHTMNALTYATVNALYVADAQEQLFWRAYLFATEDNLTRIAPTYAASA